MIRSTFFAVLFSICALAVCNAADPLSIVVMDPLAAPLSCPCVEGYAQRKYEILAEELESRLERSVTVSFGESLELGLKKANGKADVVIGKQSVVIADAKKSKLKVDPLFRLSDQEGSTSQFGMIVVNRDDPAKSIQDLKGYSIIFGTEDAEEKHGAALKLFSDAGIKLPKQRRMIDEACSDGACKVIDLGPSSKSAAVISSYAQPLLEGCGTIKKGDLRVVAKTSEVPFVTLFAVQGMDSETRKTLSDAIHKVSREPRVLEALESLIGFVAIEDEAVKKK